jgi:outer membrane protein OmpA-like peptidoglycan-associated protein
VDVRSAALTTGKKLRTTVYFPAGSSVLPPAQRAKLRRLLEQVPRNSDVSVLARGYAPKRVPAGDSPAARSRADSVVDYLNSVGLVGQTYASGTGRSGGSSKQVRRVAVTITYQEIPKVRTMTADRLER